MISKDIKKIKSGKLKTRKPWKSRKYYSELLICPIDKIENLDLKKNSGIFKIFEVSEFSK